MSLSILPARPSDSVEMAEFGRDVVEARGTSSPVRTSEVAPEVAPLLGDAVRWYAGFTAIGLELCIDPEVEVDLRG